MPRPRIYSWLAALTLCLVFTTVAPAACLVPRPPLVTPAPALTPPADLVRATVTGIIDGDTIAVRIAGQPYRVRYIGIDTPETYDPRLGPEPFSAEATEANRSLVAGRTVGLEQDTSETDRYGRLLRYVWVGDVLVNAELVRQGFAHAATFPPDVKYQGLFLRLQREAQAAGRGLWAGQAPPTRAPAWRWAHLARGSALARSPVNARSAPHSCCQGR